MAEIESSMDHAKSVAKGVTVHYLLKDYEQTGQRQRGTVFDVSQNLNYWRWFVVYNFFDHDGHDPDVWKRLKDDEGNSVQDMHFTFKWGKLGRHQVRCAERTRDGKPIGYVKFDQQVDELETILERQMDQAKKEKLVYPYAELTMMWKWLYILYELGKKQAAQLSPSAKEAHEKRLAELEAHAEKLDALLSRFKDSSITPFHAVYLAKESMEEKALRVFLAQPRDKTDRLTIVDWTNLDEPKLHGVYEGKFPPFHGRRIAEVVHEAFQNAVDVWKEDNHYWPGGIRYDINTILPNGGGLAASGTITTGDTSWTDTLEGVLKKIAMGAALIGLVLTGVGSVYAGAMIVTSMVAGATGSVLSIHHRHSKGEGDLLDDAIDALDIVANVLGVGYRAGKAVQAMAAEANAERVAWQAGRRVRLKLADNVLDAMFIGETWASGFSGILLDVKFAKRYFEIMNATGDRPEKRASDLLGLFGEAAMVGGLHSVNHKVATSGEKGEFRGLLDRLEDAEKTLVDPPGFGAHADDPHTRPTANHPAQADPPPGSEAGHADDVHTRPTANHAAQNEPPTGSAKEADTVVDAPSFPGHTQDGQKKVTVVNKQQRHPTGGAPGRRVRKSVKPFPPDDPTIWKTRKITDNEIELRTHDGFHFVAKIDDHGFVTVDIMTRRKNPNAPGGYDRSQHLGTGRENFERMFDHFEKNGHDVKGWQGIVMLDNYDKLSATKARNPEMQDDDAVLESVTGRKFWKPWAASRDLTIIVEEAKDYGSWFSFRLRFEKTQRP